MCRLLQQKVRHDRSGWQGRTAVLRAAVVALGVVMAPAWFGCGSVDVGATAAPEASACTTAADCPVPREPCRLAACVEGACSGAPAPSGARAPNAFQTSGDCRELRCTGSGEVANVDAPTDAPADDGNPCTLEGCEAGEPRSTPAPTGTACGGSGVDGGGRGVCNGLGACGQCIPGEGGCSGVTPLICDPSGRWIPGSPCALGCTPGGTCRGECSPGAAGCEGKQPRVCGADSTWTPQGPPCANVCSDGVCTGTCAPGALQCRGATPETCDDTGTWVAEASCPFACVDGRCTGLCRPGVTRCVERDAQTCSPSGEWQTTRSCPFICSGDGVCTGSCTPNTARCSGLTPELCSTAGAWTALASCPFVCLNGSCTGQCVPGARRCTGNVPQTCDATGQWAGASACAAGELCKSGVCTPCSALSTNLDGYAEVADAVALRLGSGSFTVELWAYANSLANGCNNVLLAKRGGGVASGWFYAVRGVSYGGCITTPGRLWWHQSGGGDPYLQASAGPSINQWFHAAYTYDATTRTGSFWLNGVRAGGGTYSNPSAATTAVLRIGQDSGGSDYRWKGLLDDVRLSNVARYTAPFVPAPNLQTDAATIAFWDFNEASGNALDASGNGYHATIVRATRVTGTSACRP